MNPPFSHPARECWLAPERGWLARMTQHMQACQAHPSRTVVLLPYAQLMPVAARHWAQVWPNGFAPRFETTQNWSRSLGGFTPAPTDICFDAALDVLTARAMLEQIQLGAQVDAATPLLVEAAHQLGALAAAQAPASRAAWAARARQAALTGLDAGALALEAAVAQLAVAWAANSSYASDVLFEPQVIASVECLIVLQGFQPDPLPQALQAAWGKRVVILSLDDALVAAAVQPPALHAARDAQEEAQRAAACVLQHVHAGRSPVALVANDRALTRRVRAMLAAHEISLRDETGWKLSTSRAGAHVMGALRACVWHAASDTALDWLKNAPAFDAAGVQALESRLRRQPLREWHRVPEVFGSDEQPALRALLKEVQTLRDGLQRPRTLPQWLQALRELLQRSGQWALLQDDVAGDKLLATLRLTPGATLPADALWTGRRWSLVEFTRWVDHALEGASFTPEYPLQEQVVILPLAQMLGRPFAAVVLPGCDEVRLNPSPEPPGLWTAGQREALGLPLRATLDAALRAAWQQALCSPAVDVLWRTGDDGGEPLLPSPLVQLLRLQHGGNQAADPRAQREVTPMPQLRPAPVAPQLQVRRLSASAYNDLRHCPYRFFALRQLGLKEVEELEGELDKRDFGLWLHAVLKAFHDQLKVQPTQDRTSRRALLDAAAISVTALMRLAKDEFLPYQAAWPRVCNGYLDWLAEHEAGGMRFEEGERAQDLSLGEWTLVGRLDRVDQGAHGELMVIDYKTESRDTTSKRIKEPLEDTQLAFYAALMPNDTLRAAYVNLGETTPTKTYEQNEIVEVRDALIEGIVHDMQRVAQGAAMPALGEGASCEFCAARGLCRKDFWADDVLAGEVPS